MCIAIDLSVITKSSDLLYKVYTRVYSRKILDVLPSTSRKAFSVALDSPGSPVTAEAVTALAF